MRWSGGGGRAKVESGSWPSTGIRFTTETRKARKTHGEGRTMWVCCSPLAVLRGFFRAFRVSVVNQMPEQPRAPRHRRARWQTETGRCKLLPAKQLSTTRTGVRVAEGAGLENRYTGNGIVGSNPTLSVVPSLAAGSV